MGRLVSGLSLGPFVRREQEIRGGSGGSDCFFIGKAPLLLASFRLMSALPPSRFCKKRKKGERGDRRCRIKPGKMGGDRILFPIHPFLLRFFVFKIDGLFSPLTFGKKSDWKRRKEKSGEDGIPLLPFSRKWLPCSNRPSLSALVDRSSPTL